MNQAEIQIFYRKKKKRTTQTILFMVIFLKKKSLFNYITNFEEESWGAEKTSNSFGNFKRADLNALNKGEIQKELEYAIYYNMLVATVQKDDFKNARTYVNKVMDVVEGNENYEISNAFQISSLIDSCVMLDDSAIIDARSALSFNNKNMPALSQLGFIYTYNEHFVEGEKYMRRALSEQLFTLEYFFIWYFSLKNSKIDDKKVLFFEDLINRLDQSDFPKEVVINLNYLLAFAKQSMGDVDGYEKVLNDIKSNQGFIDIEYGRNFEKIFLKGHN